MFSLEELIPLYLPTKLQVLNRVGVVVEKKPSKCVRERERETERVSTNRTTNNTRITLVISSQNFKILL